MSERRQPAAPRRADAARRSDFHLPPVQIPMIRDESTWYLNWVALAPYFPDCRRADMLVPKGIAQASR